MEGAVESEEFIEDTAHGPDITLLVVGLPIAKFRGEIAGGAHHSVCFTLATHKTVF